MRLCLQSWIDFESKSGKSFNEFDLIPWRNQFRVICCCWCCCVFFFWMRRKWHILRETFAMKSFIWNRLLHHMDLVVSIAGACHRSNWSIPYWCFSLLILCIMEIFERKNEIGLPFVEPIWKNHPSFEFLNSCAKQRRFMFPTLSGLSSIYVNLRS